MGMYRNLLFYPFYCRKGRAGDKNVLSPITTINISRTLWRIYLNFSAAIFDLFERNNIFKNVDIQKAPHYSLFKATVKIINQFFTDFVVKVRISCETFFLMIINWVITPIVYNHIWSLWTWTHTQWYFE